MISAAEARAAMPQHDIDDVFFRVEVLIRGHAARGETSIDLPSNLLPDNGVGKWACGNFTASAALLRQTLHNAGYRVTTDPGGHHGRGYVRIHWNDR